jgi:hypothetical protein
MENPTKHRVVERISELRELAIEDGITIQEDSVDAFLRFFRTFPLHDIAHGPFIFLDDDGLIRAMWKMESGEKLALTFKDKRQGRFVVLNGNPVT